MAVFEGGPGQAGWRACKVGDFGAKLPHVKYEGEEYKADLFGTG